MRPILDWLEERTGVESAIKHFLYEDIPDSAGWHQVLGSVALFAFLTQAFTGILLAFNYAPTPGDAYDSLRYIVTELTGGRLIRGLHHWGASLMIIVVVLHMAQVFLWGAYKKPREATWMVGCILLLVTLAYGLTGYLLPWDNRAYWGTVVTTQIASQAPGAGPYILRLLGSEGGAIGVVTFARFYAVHVLLLPPLTMLLVGIHVFLVRKHGVAPAADDFKPKKKFYPEQVFKDTVATFLWFAVLVGMAIIVKVPLGRTADPTDTSFIPRPEWYFLFLFQILKVFEGPLEIVGSLVLPTLAILALVSGPIYRSGQASRDPPAYRRNRLGDAGCDRLGRTDGARGRDHASQHRIAGRGPGAGRALARDSAREPRGDRIFSQGQLWELPRAREVGRGSGFDGGSLAEAGRLADAAFPPACTERSRASVERDSAQSAGDFRRQARR